MAGNGSKPGDAKSEELREKYAARLDDVDRHLIGAKIREELASADFGEDSAVIQREIDRQMAERGHSEAPISKFHKLTKGWPWWGQLVLILAGLGALVWKGADLLRWLRLIPG
jgi:hypothetical protein